jgi:hypothetical protein
MEKEKASSEIPMVIGSFNLTDIPSPSHYKTKVDSVKPASAAFSFGVSRSAFHKVALEGQTIDVTTDVPGPGTYSTT